MGRIPHFTWRIFPEASISYLNLVANVGLILFLFLVGLEVDVGVMRKNGRNSAIISLISMAIPFGLGAAVAVPIYNTYVDKSTVTFGHFLLFVGVAMSITAFPVLCRILTSCKLLHTSVGLVVLAAGVGNDVVGWVLLALTLALVNSTGGVTAVYVLLTAVGWALILFFPIRWGFQWLARRSGSLEHGPTPGMITVTLLVVFASAFVTGIIGVHPIFGAFIAGLIIPHEGGFAIALVEKIDDLISLLFIPIYFVLSGLSTNLGLLDHGEDWGYIILLCFIGWAGKFFGCAITAKLLGYNLRESGAIGMLMSCKGLVELIVLNVGLSAGIINQRLFSMFVVVALVLTFVTTPGTLWIYPERYRTRISGGKQITSDSEGTGSGLTHLDLGAGGREFTNRILVVLQKAEHLSASMFLTQLLEQPWSTRSIAPVPSHSAPKKSEDAGDLSLKPSTSRAPTLATSGENDVPPSTITSGAVRIDALKLIELTGRTHSVMQSAEIDQMLVKDDTLQLYRQFGLLRGFQITPHISIVETDSFPASIADYAEHIGSEMVIVPWTIPVLSNNSTALIDPSSSATAEKEGVASSSTAPLDSVFGTESTGSPMYTHFLRRVFTECPADLAVFVDRGFGSSSTVAPGAGQHIYLPFFGGADDRLALRLVVQLCHHANVTATIIRFARPTPSEDDEGSSDEAASPKREEPLSPNILAHQTALQTNELTVAPTGHNAYPGTEHRLASETADDLAWGYYQAEAESARSRSLDAAIGRMVFKQMSTARPLSEAFAQADAEARSNEHGHAAQWRSLLVVLGRGRRGAAMKHSDEAARFLTERSVSPSIGAELRKTVGDVAAALILGGGAPSSASYLVLEAAKR